MCLWVELKSHGQSLDNAALIQLYVSNMVSFSAVNAAYCRHFSGDRPPARACVQVSRVVFA